MKKRGIIAALLIFLFPASYVFFNQYINFDTLSAVLFLLIIIVLVIRNRKILNFQTILGLGKLPLVYAVLWKTKFGLKFMDNIANKYRETIKLIGYCFIGLGFVGMIFISVNLLIMLFRLFITPKETAQGVSLVLPLTNIPGIGYLSFWYFLITIFVAVLIHEFSHGIVARAHKVPVNASGLGVFSLILPLFPLAFVEPDEKKLQKNKDVVQYSIFSAGPMVNVIFALLLLLLMSFVIFPVEDSITHPVGLSFNAVMENYSAEEAGMKPGMIINEVNGKEVLTYQEFSEEIGELEPGQELTIGTDKGTFNIVTKPAPDEPDKGYIGILDIRNERRMNREYERLSGTYFWLRGLVKWMYILNLIIGLMNLLPLMVTDGGRMLKTALEKIIKDTKKANKAWVFVGAVFIFTLLFALIVRYSLELLSFLSLG
ncbi:hypothetical protein GF323_04020 [Candidatus Woesearchaeota archaeon]|nr:hypothetical protein [Candidatus Woesearchaeota archaeon]